MQLSVGEEKELRRTSPSGPLPLPRPSDSFGQIDTDWLIRGHDDVSGETTFDPTGVEPSSRVG